MPALPSRQRPRKCWPKQLTLSMNSLTPTTANSITTETVKHTAIALSKAKYARNSELRYGPSDIGRSQLMTSKGTPHRPIRISDELWAKAQAKAAREGTTASQKARELLAKWADEPDDTPDTDDTDDTDDT